MAPDPRPHGNLVERLAPIVPTSRHASMLFDMLVDHLGELAVIHTAADGGVRWLYRREAPGGADIVPWPVAVMSLGGRTDIVISDSDAAGWGGGPRSPDVPPSRLRGLRPGQLILHDGAQRLAFAYGEDGRFPDLSQDLAVPGRLGGIVDALAARTAQPVELVAAYLASLAPTGHGPGRVRLPVPMPGNAAAVFEVGLRGARRALFDGRVPATARFLVADGVAGTAIGFGATRAEAVLAFEADVRRAPPRPSTERHASDDDYDDDGRLVARGAGFACPVDAPPSSPFASMESVDVPFADAAWGTPDLQAMRMRGPTPDVPMPSLSVATTPSALFPLDPLPATPAPVGAWIRTLGARGATGHAVRWERADGFVLLGERVLPHVRLGVLDAQLDDAEGRSDVPADGWATLSPARASFVRYVARRYRLVPARGTGPAEFVALPLEFGPRFDPGLIDGEPVPAEVRRQRRIRRGSVPPPA